MAGAGDCLGYARGVGSARFARSAADGQAAWAPLASLAAATRFAKSSGGPGHQIERGEESLPTGQSLRWGADDGRLRVRCRPGGGRHRKSNARAAGGTHTDG